MQINVNNNLTSTEAGTLAELMAELKMPEVGVAVALENRMVPRLSWHETKLTEHASITIIKAACGG